MSNFKIWDWLEEGFLLILTLGLLYLGFRLNFINGLDLTRKLELGDVGAILGAIITLTAAITSFSSKREIQKRLNEHDKQIQSQLSMDIASALGFTFLDGQDKNYEKAAELIQSLSKREKPPKLLLTDFSGDFDPQNKSTGKRKEFLAKFTDYVQKGGEVIQINYHDPLGSRNSNEVIQRVRERINWIPQAEHYQIYTILSRKIVPYFDMLIIEGEAALLTTTDNPTTTSPHPGSAIFIQYPKGVHLLENTFHAIRSQALEVRGLQTTPTSQAKALDQLKQQINGDYHREPIALGVKANYQAAKRIVEEAATDSRIQITALSRSPEHTFSIQEMKDYEHARDNRIKNDECYIQRIVAISDKKDIEDLRAHLEACKMGGKNYELYCLRGPDWVERDQPFFSMLLTQKEALLEIPLIERGKEKLSALHFIDDESLSSLKESFDALLKIAQPLKREGQVIDDDFLANLDQKLEQIGNQYLGISRKPIQKITVE